MLYLDYAASTKVNREVLNVFNEVTEKYFANPNSVHKLGQDAKTVIDEAIAKTATILNCESDEIIYTSGASETNNLVIKGICERYKSKGKHILIGPYEHNSIVSSVTAMQNKGFDIEVLSLTKDGLIDLNDLKNKLREDTILVSIASIDSELGIRQSIEEIGAILKDKNCFFHTDASQSFGKESIDYSLCDLVTITPHKFYGLSGIGILIKRKNISLIPQIDGGKSTTVYRSGTPTTALIAASAKALELINDNFDSYYSYVTNLNKKIKNELSKYSNLIFNSNKYSTPYIINISIKGIKANDLVKKLEENKVYVSAKTSCCPVEGASKLVYALTKDKTRALSSIRISLSHLLTIEDIDNFLKIFDKVLGDINGKI